MHVDKPVKLGSPSPEWGGNNAPEWGSDAIALALRQIRLPYVALNPGASYRGLHDSIVNFLGNSAPEMLLCLHEEHAVAIAHGYAKVTGQPMGVLLHSNVGLMHATMAIFNAWCDRVPIVLLGATGPVDAAQRRPWIDWIHTAKDQGALVRHYVKWDDQPSSAAACLESIARANIIARTAPKGPVYLCFDAALQESPIGPLQPLDPARFQPAPPPHPAPEAVSRAAALLAGAERPLILAGRVSRDAAAWQQRVALAERLGAKVLTDLKVGSAFPTDHPLHAAPPVFFLSPEATALLLAADVVLSLDWLDLAGTLKAAWGGKPPTATVIQSSCDQYVHNGWSMDHQGLAPIDLTLLCEPDIVVAAVLAALGDQPVRSAWPTAAVVAKTEPEREPDSISYLDIAESLSAATAGRTVSMIRLPLGWPSDRWHFRDPLSFLGFDGGGGVGSGPGLVIGAALALKGSGLLPVALIGDGDFLMGSNAIWTAAHYHIPMLMIVANNRSFFNDELHQDRVARERRRPVENRWIGQRIDDPAPDLAALARSQGMTGLGPVAKPEDLLAVLQDAVEQVEAGRPVVVEVLIKPRYEPTMANAMVRKGAHD